MDRYRRLAALNADRDAFMAAIGSIVEHSSWVAERAFVYRPFSSIEALHGALMKCIRDAPLDEQIALFNMHPELAGREAIEGQMTAESTGEQGRLGLTALSAAELAELTALNRRYREKFGFPFIAALRLHTDRRSLIETFRNRIENPRELEIANAINQIAEIVRGRLERIFDDGMAPASRAIDAPMTDPDYPRDLKGYGRTPPDPRWPNRARVAVQFVVNFEEGGENNILHGDAGSEAFLSDVLGAPSWKGRRHPNVESMFEYGSRAGFWRLWRGFGARNIKPTVFAVATALARNPDCVAAMNESGWDIASHGLKWIEHKDIAEADERAAIAEAVRLHTQATGQRPTGWYTGRTSENTLRLVIEQGGFLYSCDSYADDLPYWVSYREEPHLIIPYSLDANDMRFINPQGFGGGEQFFQYLKDSFDVLYAEGETAPKMMSVGLHCRLVGRPGRFAALLRFLDYIEKHDRVWVPTRLQIAEHWRSEHRALVEHAHAIG